MLIFIISPDSRINHVVTVKMDEVWWICTGMDTGAEAVLNNCVVNGFRKEVL
jgi:hypothetical protein